jgi:hypothetical protein
VNSFGFGGSNSHCVVDDAYHFLKTRGLVGNHCTVIEPPVVRNLSVLESLILHKNGDELTNEITVGNGHHVSISSTALYGEAEQKSDRFTNRLIAQ